MTKRSIAIVTGASQTRDIGAAICRQLVSSGHDLVLLILKQQRIGRIVLQPNSKIKVPESLRLKLI